MLQVPMQWVAQFTAISASLIWWLYLLRVCFVTVTPEGLGDEAVSWPCSTVGALCGFGISPDQQGLIPIACFHGKCLAPHF